MAASPAELFLVVMAGGSGTRFWPKSTSKRPKQLLSFEGESGDTLIAKTLKRFKGLVKEDERHRLIVTTRLLESEVRRAAPGTTVLAEPQGRNTAPCVYWAAREVASRDPRGVMLVMPSDHYIADEDAFRATVREAAQKAAEGRELVTLGVTPTRPETGYGYLKIARAGAKTGSVKVEAFVEKPNLERAENFFKSGQYLWNGGMFLWRVDVILAAFDKFMPEMKREWDAARGAQKDAKTVVEVAYPKMTATSIDFGVMEKAANVVTFPLDCGWDDLGSWTSLEALGARLGAVREEGVVINGQAISIEAAGNIVDVPRRLVALLGVNDLIVVEHGETLLVARKDRAQDIKLLVDKVKKVRPELI